MKSVRLYKGSLIIPVYWIPRDTKLGKRLFNMYKADRHLGSVYNHFLLGISEDLSLLFFKT